MIAVDSSNRIHLEANKNGRQVMTCIILKKCKDTETLKEEPKKSISSHGHLIVKPASPIEAKGKSGKRSNLSFVSKFCFYAANYLGIGEKNEYSIYDRIVLQKLPDYLSKLKIVVEDKDFSFDKKNEKERIRIYKRYCEALGELVKRPASTE